MYYYPTPGLRSGGMCTQLIQSYPTAHHAQTGPQQRATTLLAHHPETKVVQTLRGVTDEGGGKRGVIAPDHRIAGDTPTGAAVRQLAEIGHTQCRVWVERDGWDFKLLISQAGSVECLQVREREGLFLATEEKSGRRGKEDRGRVEGKRETEKKKCNGRGREGEKKMKWMLLDAISYLLYVTIFLVQALNTMDTAFLILNMPCYQES